MSFFPWSDEYSVHFRVIDNDHRDLVEIVNALHDSIVNAEGRTQVGRTLSRLATYVDAHFAREEQLMEEYSYPGIIKHKRLHRHLARKVPAIRKVFAENPRRIDPAKLLSFLRDWLVHHILEQDTQYAPYFRGKVEETPDFQSEADGDEELEVDFAEDERSGADGAGPYQTITLTVPAVKAPILLRCAMVLSEDGPISDAIEDMVMPVGRMTLEEAERTARDLLRESGPAKG